MKIFRLSLPSHWIFFWSAITLLSVEAQQTEPEKIVISFPNMPLPVILGEYEQLTGFRIVKDNAVLGASLSIETQQELTPNEAAEFIEKSLLLNGYALIPNGKNILKIVAFGDGKQPISEGIPIITRREQLPESDVVLTYLHPLHHTSPGEAQKQLSEIFSMHSYGKLVSLEASSTLVITENAFTILKMLEVLDRMDLPPTEITHRNICLERADPEEVVEAVSELLGLGSSTQEGENQTVGLAISDTRQSTRRFLGGLPTTREIKPKLQAIPRTNRILVVGKLSDIEQIATLVSYFDEPVERKHLMKRKLNYVSVATFLPIAHHTLLRSQEAQNATIAGGEETDQATVSTGSVGGNTASTDEIQDTGPQSLIVGKTLLIADNIQNTLLMSGPAEDLETLCDLVDSMDLKPRQILISAIIAQLTLGKDFNYGLDLIRTLGGSNVAGTFRNSTGSIRNPDTLNVFENLLPAGNGLSIYGQINPALDTFLSTIENHNRFKVLSRPTIYTLNNRRAEILSGQRIAVPRTQQSSVSPNQALGQVVTSSIDFEEVLLRIEVIPLINEEDNITLQIAQTNEDIVGNQIIGGDQIPTIGTQALKTTVIVENGGTILLGGLISEEGSKTKNGAPIMVNLPLVGDFFGNSQVNNQRQELMIFIQPRIVDNSYDLTKTDADLYERSKFLDETMEFAKPEYEARARPIELPKKRGFLKRLLQLDKIE